MKLFGRRKQAEDAASAAADEGIVGLWVRKTAAVEEEYAKEVITHLGHIHEPNGLAREKQRNDFMDLGMERSYLESLDDLEFTIDEWMVYMFAGVRKRGSAQIVTRWTVRGVHNRPLLGIAPTGEPVTLTGITYTRMRNYKIQTDFNYWELPELTRRMVEQCTT
jgi:hypothetical protein